MAGIFDRIGRGLSTHHICAAIHLVARGFYTQAQARDAINTQLAENSDPTSAAPLSAAAESDLSAIVTRINSFTGSTGALNKIGYAGDINAVFITFEAGRITEASARTILVI